MIILKNILKTLWKSLIYIVENKTKMQLQVQSLVHHLGVLFGCFFTRKNIVFQYFLDKFTEKTLVQRLFCYKQPTAGT